jgi:hypothetical protein
MRDDSDSRLTRRRLTFQAIDEWNLETTRRPFADKSLFELTLSVKHLFLMERELHFCHGETRIRFSLWHYLDRTRRDIQENRVRKVNTLGNTRAHN